MVRVDPNDPEQLYGESQNGYTFRLHLGTGEQSSIRARPPRGERYRFNWNTPFILSPHNSKVYYSAGNHVFRSPDRGNGLQAISPDIAYTDRGAATALHESPVREGVLYVGTDDGALWMTPDGGHEWIDLFNPPPLPEAEGDAAAGDAQAEAPEAQPERGAGRARAPRHPLAGSWQGQAVHEQLGEGEGSFSMNLQVDEEGVIAGSMLTDLGDTTISEGRFDAEANTLRFRFTSAEGAGGAAGIVEGELTENAMSGTIDVGPGMITLEFTAKREAPRGGTRGGRGAGAGARAGGVQGRDLSELPPDVQERIRERQAAGGGRGGFRGAGGAGGGAARSAQAEEAGPGLAEIAPGRFHVSSIQASQHRAERVYVTFDGHRSNDDLPHVLVSEDLGRSWASLRGNLPDSAGSARVIVEDYANPNLLFLGTEFGAWASIDRGQSWTRINSGELPTVPVHDFKLHRLTGELIAGTHGRSIWITDVSTLRQLNAEEMREEHKLYAPEEGVIWSRDREAGSSGTRRFVGENPRTGTALRYSLAGRARSVRLWITDIRGETIAEFEAETTPGLHEFWWDLRQEGEGNRRWRRPVPAGQYLVQLRVDGSTQSQVLEVLDGDS